MVAYNKDDITLRFLGGCKEVGRMAILIEDGKGNRALLDYGVSFTDDKPLFPVHVRPRDVNFIVLTHAHLDHSGGLPLLYSGQMKIPILTTEMSIKLSSLLWFDFIRIARHNLPFEEVEAKIAEKNVKSMYYNEELEVNSFSIKLIDAGHIPGSACVLIEVNDKKILYTGDFNIIETQLLRPAQLDQINFKELDAVIMETTYANVDHPDRRELEKEFVDEAREVIERGGIVLVPAFAVGRSQEIICILKKYGFEHPVVLDGMARIASKLILEGPQYLRDYKFVKDALSSVKWVMRREDRRKALKRPSLIVTPAGMLKGGAALYYLKKIYKDPKNAIFLVSYQIPGTPGRQLLDTGTIPIDGKPEKVEAKVKWFDFSAHCGRKELIEVISKLEPGTKLFLVHGEEEAIREFMVYVRDNFDLEVINPEVGATYSI
ncbi:MAG: MBL fold metallo-hydrolase [Thermoprotei archaeon]|nr:MAG: MBL fold metallo-hydrolase [Thermoprotei archaeon]